MAQGAGASDSLPQLVRLNLDLQLYKAKQKQRAARSCKTAAERAAALQAAEAMYRHCLAMAPKEGRAYVGLGRLLVQQRRFNEAERLYEDGSRMSEGSNCFIWQAWATLEVRRRNVKQARKLFQAAIAANKHHAASWHGWGLLEKSEGDLMRARELWLEGIRRSREQPNAHLLQSVAVLAGEMGLTDESRRWFQQAARLVSGNSHGIWQAWAVMEARQGDPSLVRDLFRRGLRESPQSPYLHLAFGQWERQQGNPETARFLLRRGCQLTPTDPALAVAWACLEEDCQRVDDARALFRKATEVDAHHVPAWQAHGCFEFRQGAIAEARSLFQHGIWADPSSKAVAPVWQAWAILEQQEGDLQLARQMFQCAVRADPCSQTSWESWAALEEGTGDAEHGEQLRSAGKQASLRVRVPRNFAAGFALPPAVSGADERPGPLASIQQQVSAWLTAFGGLRSTSAESLDQHPSTAAQSGDVSPAASQDSRSGSAARDSQQPGRFQGSMPATSAASSLRPMDSEQPERLRGSAAAHLPPGSGAVRAPVPTADRARVVIQGTSRPSVEKGLGEPRDMQAVLEAAESRPSPAVQQQRTAASSTKETRHEQPLQPGQPAGVQPGSNGQAVGQTARAMSPRPPVRRAQ